MKNELTTIAISDLDTVTGGASRAGRAANWAWNNVAKPLGVGAAWDWASNTASNWWNNRSQPQQPAQPPTTSQQ